ncbi:hypothetical protein INT43_001671 [Umbelopsis isabellina]|uniref:C2H2-type domain-containing protein n=1 Tax=Mortierella isabellina TaxID=91625 RepID=A0A8H7PRY5_MORIS|nr:hypothetical protein INT43_001671 [Umbelopsis isabellina]
MTDESDAQSKSMRKPSRNDSSRKPKLFRCTGYGNCNMVFTRSEHLARHARKHTGEKPFQCVVPGCGRMFSRFDNMMQHTQTHNNGKSTRRTKVKTKKRPAKRDSGSSTSTSMSIHKRNHSQSSVTSSPYDMSSDESEYTPYKRPRSGAYRRDSTGTHRSSYSLDDSPPTLPPPSYITHETIPPVEHLIGSWHSKSQNSASPPSPLAPLSPPMSNESPTGYLALRSWRLPIASSWRRKSLEGHQPLSPLSPMESDFSILPKLASYLVKNPDKSPESFYRRHRSMDDSYTRRDIKKEHDRYSTRRLSVADLCNPIESLCQGSDWANTKPEEKTISLTEDEFEALQGFSRFRLGSTSQERHSLHPLSSSQG